MGRVIDTDPLDEPPLRLVEILMSMADYSGAEELNSSDDGALCLVDILLLPVVVPIAAVTVAVTFVCMMLCNRLLATNPMNAPLVLAGPIGA